MSAFTVRRPDMFPDGTSVAAYVAATAGPGGVAPTSGAPAGSVVETQVAAAGALVFSGLAARTSYVLYAGGPDRYLRLNTSAGGSVYPELSGDPADDTKAISAGTGTALSVISTSAFRRSVGFDIRDYGAVCDWDGSTGTNDTAAVQAAVADLIANGGGRLIVPGPTRVVPLAGGVVVDIPASVPCSIEGVGATHQLTLGAAAEVPMLVATAAGTILRIRGTGTSGSQRAYASLDNMRLDGNSVAGVLGLDMRAVNNLAGENNIIGNCPAGGINADQVWNSQLGVKVFRCGAPGVPAVRFGSLADLAANSGCNTVNLAGLEIEECYGTFLLIEGDESVGSANFAIFLSDFKLEGFTTDEPLLDIVYGSGITFTNGFIARTAGGSISAPDPIVVLRHAAATNTINAVQFSNITFLERYDAEVLIDVSGDKTLVSFNGCCLDSATVTTGGIRIASDVGDDAVDIGTLLVRRGGLGASANLPLVVDERTGDGNLANAVVAPLSATATEVHNTSSHRTSWTLRHGTDADEWTGVVAVGPDADATAHPTLRVYVGAAATPTGRLTVFIHNGTLRDAFDLTVVPTRYDQTVAIASADHVHAVDFDLTDTTINPNTGTQVTVRRTGTNGADTAGDIDLYGAALLYAEAA